MIVSYEWSIHEYTPDENDFIPTGYYIQLYAMTLLHEMYDDVCIADGLFLFLVCVIPQFRYCTADPKFQVLQSPKLGKKVYHFVLIIMATSVAIAYTVACM